MAVKTYRAKNLCEAFAMIRKDFGLNATLLETREIQTRRMFGLLPGESCVEVTATDGTADLKSAVNLEPGSSLVATESPTLEAAAASLTVAVEKKAVSQREPEVAISGNAFWDAIQNAAEPQFTSASGIFGTPQDSSFYGSLHSNEDPGFRKRTVSARRSVSDFRSDSGSTPNFSAVPSPQTDDSGLLFGGGSGFFRQIAALSESQASQLSGHFRDALLQIYAKLQTADMDEGSITELMTRLREDELLYAAAGNRQPNSDMRFLEQKLQDLVAQEIQTTGPIQIHSGKRQTIALVGPTGVGKTTTIAKLAIDYRQKKNCQVGLITLDLSRMGAVEQLQTFADVIGIPMLCASTRRQMREAVARMADFDLVLIDTAGQSRADEMTLREMRVFFEEARVNDVMLVLSSTARTRVLKQTVDSFASIGTTSLILTKLDESLGLGNLFPLLQSTPLPISYLTNGQKVPDDFETADRIRLARLILGDEQIASRFS